MADGNRTRVPCSTGRSFTIKLQPPCAPGRIRTYDLLLRRQLLYPLSYRRLERERGIEPLLPPWKGGVKPINYSRSVGVLGLEPRTSSSQTRRASQLRYTPVPKAGVEPAWPCSHEILSLACIPVPPPRPGCRARIRT